MENSALGTLGKRVITWLVLAAVALLALKLAFGIVLGLVQAVVSIALLVLVVMGVVWALRHL